MCVLGNENVESIKKYHIPFEQIEVETKLGKGSFGKVCLGRWNHAPVALKFCKGKEKLDDFLREANLAMYLIELRNLFQIQHEKFTLHILVNNNTFFVK
jgi:predicted Ser/Thr protein kinase